MVPRILFVFTSAEKNLKGGPTGWFLPEAAHPYYVLKGHTEIDFASPKGPNPPVDQSSVKIHTDENSVKFLHDEEVKTKLTNTKKLSDVSAADYDAIFYIGGHGPVLDLAQDPVNAKLASEFFRSGKITSAVCHGTAALVGVTDANGKSIFAGRTATGFSNAEEVIVDGVDLIPFLLEDRIKELGGHFTQAAEPWGVEVVVSDNLYTGQNPGSAQALGEVLLKALKGLKA